MTNKVVLRSIEEFQAGFVPVYQPVLPLFLSGAQSYSPEAGKMTFEKLEAVGDLRAKMITPKDTEMQQISAQEKSRIFKKYFFANQFTCSALQDQKGVEDVVAEVLDEHNKQADGLLIGDSGVTNNALYYSNDANYVAPSSEEIDTDADPLIGMHAQVVANAKDADDVAGRKLILFYGDNVLPKYDSLYASQPVPFKRVLKEVLGENYSLAKLPADITPAGADGWMIVNLDQIKLHYTALPQLLAQGVNDEKMYAWFNFLMGSMMLEVKAYGGIIRQEVTFEA